MSRANKTEKDSLWFNSGVFMFQVGKGSKVLDFVLFCFCQMTQARSHLRSGNINCENASIIFAYRQACVSFPLSMINVGMSKSLWAVPLLGRWSWVA